jgi:Flp pilus assembly CpaE family ATPase
MDDAARVVLALEAQEVAEEVLHFLDRSGLAQVVATASDDRQLAEAVRQLEPDAVVAEPALTADHVPGAVPLLALATRESVATLRGAIRAGAQGFFVWPDDRDELLLHVASLGAARRMPERRATVVAVHAARGGAGCTFVATHLAQAFACADADCVLIDCDLAFGDVTHVLGVAGQDVRTIGDLVPVGDELEIAHLDGIVHRHSSGFAVVLAPPVSELETVSIDLLRRVVAIAAGTADVVVLHTGRAPDEATAMAFREADRVIEVVSLDVLSFRATTRLLEASAHLDLEGRLGFVVDRAARSEITPGDVRRVFGADPLVVIPFDGSVPRLQDHGRLVPPRGRIGRSFARLAERLAAAPAEEDREAS